MLRTIVASTRRVVSTTSSSSALTVPAPTALVSSQGAVARTQGTFAKKATVAVSAGITLALAAEVVSELK
ncbi:hypothetical protein HDU96_007043 [Phlyctochytrium bullatum]|nr:hypothetical protein HDU96_007043 [Phlyctochytrium bullatum]